MIRVGISVTPVYTIHKESKNIDGIGTYTANLCQALTKASLSVQEIYFKKPSEILTSTPGDKENLLIANNPLCSLFPGDFFNNIHDKVDLLHVTDYLVPCVRNTPTISTIHDSIMLKHPEWQKNNRALRLLKGYLLKKLAKNADHVITCSQASIPDIVNFWKIPENKISVTPYGLSEIWYQRIDPLIQQKILQKYKLTKPFFLTVGTLQPRKNLERIINAYLNLPKHIADNFNLVIAGKEHPALTPPSLLETIQRLEQTRQLVWLKYVPFQDLQSLYQSAHILLYPSLAEGFGFPILEGFASGTPVLTSHFGSTAEIAEDAAYLVDPYSEEAIIAAIQELVEKPDTRQRLIQQGLSRARLFTWEKCAEQTLAVYKKLL